MKILTSHIANKKRCIQLGYSTAMISRIDFSKDKNFYDNVIDMLAPATYSLDLPRNEFLEEYRKVLNRLDQNRLLDLLERISNNGTVVLLSNTEDPAKCHRRYLAQYLEKITGEPVPEMEETKKQTQKSMF